MERSEITYTFNEARVISCEKSFWNKLKSIPPKLTVKVSNQHGVSIPDIKVDFYKLAESYSIEGTVETKVLLGGYNPFREIALNGGVYKISISNNIKYHKPIPIVSLHEKFISSVGTELNGLFVECGDVIQLVIELNVDLKCLAAFYTMLVNECNTYGDAVTHKYCIKFDERYWKDQTFFLDLFKNEPSLYREGFWDGSIRSDKELALQMIAIDGTLIANTNYRSIKDKDIVLKAIASTGLALVKLPLDSSEYYFSDPEVVLSASKNLSESEMKKYPRLCKVIFATAMRSKIVMESDEGADLIKRALALDGLFLKHLPAQSSHTDLVLTAIDSNPISAIFAREEALKSDNVIRRLENNCLSLPNITFNKDNKESCKLYYGDFGFYMVPESFPSRKEVRAPLLAEVLEILHKIDSEYQYISQFPIKDTSHTRWKLATSSDDVLHICSTSSVKWYTYYEGHEGVAISGLSTGWKQAGTPLKTVDGLMISLFDLRSPFFTRGKNYHLDIMDRELHDRDRGEII